MDSVIKMYKAVPSVVRADEETEISITAYDGNFLLFDDVEYTVTVTPRDVSDVPNTPENKLGDYNKSRKMMHIKPQNGVLKLKYFFSGEQMWRIHISSTDYRKHQPEIYSHYPNNWGWVITYPEKGRDIYVYSLYPDLYGRTVRKGDLHIHTNFSDGSESPDYVCASYRKSGRDFVAITDHNIFNASEKTAEKLSFAENFKIICGEEVHNGYLGNFHMVNIGGNYSVNDIYINNPEKAEKEAKLLEGTVEIPGNVDKKDYLERVWLYREIKKSGGFAIFPHPFWNIGYNNTSSKMTAEIIKNGLCDAFEVIGGCKPFENNLQVNLWNDLRAEGHNIPVVGSTDAHTVFLGSHLTRYTIVFGDDITDSISDFYSVAVESLSGENQRVYGTYRLSSYAHFLMEYYFPVHDELCAVSGAFMEQYLIYNRPCKAEIVSAEEAISQHRKEFFGY